MAIGGLTRPKPIAMFGIENWDCGIIVPEAMEKYIHSLSQRLFWDVDPETIDEQAHCRYIIQRVLERGNLEDLRATIAHYTMPFVIAEAQQMRSLDPVTLAFAACLGNVKEGTFRCCTSKR